MTIAIFPMGIFGILIILLGRLTHKEISNTPSITTKRDKIRMAILYRRIFTVKLPNDKAQNSK